MTNQMNEYDEPESNSALKGYKVAIIIMTVLLLALSFQYFRQVNMLRESEEMLSVERDTLQSRLGTIMGEFEDIQTENDTINHMLGIEKQRADSLMDRLRNERSWSYAKIKKYEQELGTLRTVMKGYVHQIDSLNQMNQHLVAENRRVTRELSGAQMRAESAEEQNQEFKSKLKKGAVIRARDITLKALRSNDKETTRVRNASRLRTDLVLSANELAIPGVRVVYIRIIGPEGYVLAGQGGSLFEYEGDKISFSASREVDYQGEDLNVSLYYNGGGITAGKYQLEVYLDGYVVGTNEIILK